MLGSWRRALRSFPGCQATVTGAVRAWVGRGARRLTAGIGPIGRGPGILGGDGFPGRDGRARCEAAGDPRVRHRRPWALLLNACGVENSVEPGW